MSVPSTSSKKLSEGKPGGTSPSPIESIEVVPGPSSLDPMHCTFPQDGESEEYGDEEDEDDDESSEEESEVSSSYFLIHILSWFVYRIYFI